MDFLDVVEQRRAVNFFDPQKDVSDETLRKIVETAAKAPSGFNLQPWNLVVLRDPAEKARLRKIAWDQPKISDAPVVLMVLGDREGFKKGHPTFERNFSEMVATGLPKEKYDWLAGAVDSLYGVSPLFSVAFAAKNAAFFAMTLMLAAKNAGLDSHPMDGFDHDAVKREFKIPDRFWIPLLMAIGHFDQSKTLNAPKWRKTYDEIVVRF